MFDVKSLTRNNIVFITEDCRFIEAAKLLCMSDQAMLPVVNQCVEIVGILTEKDILNWLCNGRDRNARVVECMRTDFTCLDGEAGLIDTVYLFARHNYSQIPVVCDEVLAGLIRKSSVIKYLVDRKTSASRRSKKKIKQKA